MKFIISSSVLLKQLQNLYGIINHTNALPILDNYLFSLSEKSLTITASDSENIMSSTVEVQSEYSGEIAMNARLLLEAIKTFPDQPLTFIINQERNTLEITSDFGNYDMAFFDGEEFPRAATLESPATIHIDGAILESAIRHTLFAAAADDLRPAMNGVFFQFLSDKTIFVATDAHKLVKYTRKDIQSEQVMEFIVPRKPLGILKNVLSSLDTEVTIEYNENNARFSFDHTTLTCRLIDSKYPNYEAVIPKENPNKLIVNRESFLTSVKRASLFSSKTTHQVRLKMSGQTLNINAEDIDFSNRADETISCNYDGDDMQIGFNSKFLIEMLNNLDSEEILIEMSVPNRAGILTPLDHTDENEEIMMLVMPVMIKQNPTDRLPNT